MKGTEIGIKTKKRLFADKLELNTLLLIKKGVLVGLWANYVSVFRIK